MMSDESRGPDLPPVPRARRSIGVLIYAALVLTVLGGWVSSNTTGWPLGRTQSTRETFPAGVRTSPGGYRTFLFFHSGYQGGK
jgi:hypothetical protein